MLPKIIFKYSHIYDQNWQTWFGIYKKIPQKVSFQKIQNYIGGVDGLWKKDEEIILNEISKVARLRWVEKEIICYVVSDCRPFSDPLTLPVYKDKNYFVDILTHELIHQLFTQKGNYEKAEKAWRYIHRKYKKESFVTRIHIPLYAIHTHIYKKIFNEIRMHKDMHWMRAIPDYKKAWEIVEKDGYENIIKEFYSRIVK